jgi:NADPH:quinone reductase-like Zn-dependent oxidoreductase
MTEWRKAKASTSCWKWAARARSRSRSGRCARAAIWSSSGYLTGKAGDRDEARKNDRGVRVDSVYVGSVRHFEHLNDALAKTNIEPVIDRTFPFESAPQAYRLLESGGHFGKIVITV